MSVLCVCGGMMKKDGRKFLKTTKETRQGFRCIECGKRKYFYKKEGGEWVHEQRKIGRPLGSYNEFLTVASA